MNHTSVFSSFKHYGTAYLCGNISALPFAILLVEKVKPLNYFFTNYQAFFIATFIIISFIVGLLCLELSVCIEDWLDKKISARYNQIVRAYDAERSESIHIQNWYLYLLKSIKPGCTLIIHKHVNYLVERMKFLSSLLVAISLFIVGLLLLACGGLEITKPTLILCIIILSIIIFLLYNKVSKLTKHLSYLRKILIENK
jgi:hypothetical protein